jgi:hypothetical protein
VFGASREDAERARGVLKDGLAKRGLPLSQEQTRSVHLTEGFDFLGVTRRHDPDARTRTGYRLRITPSKKSVAKLRETLRAEWPPLLGAHVPAVLHRLHPIIRGWANYFRGRIASRVFHQLDDGRDRRARSDVRHSPPTKPWNWLLNRYGGRLTTHRADHWGGWRPPLRTLSAQIQVVPHPPACAGPWRGCSRQWQGARRVGKPGPSQAPGLDPQQAAARQPPARRLPGVPSAALQWGSTPPTSCATACHRGRRRAGKPATDPLVLPPADPQPEDYPSRFRSARPRDASAACLSRVPSDWHARF